MVPVAQETTANTVRLPYSFSRRFSLVAWCEASLEILHVHPLSLSVLQELQRGLNAPFTLRQIDEAEFEQRLNAVWQRDSSEARQLMEDLGSAEDFFTLAEELPETEDLLESDDDAPIIKLINAMLAEAIKEGASDIHIETFEKSLVIRFRVDGTLHEMLRPGRKLASLLVSRIKVMARLDIAEKRVPQDGRIALLLGGRAIDVRVSTMPSAWGERVVLRLLDKNQARLTLERLGLSQQLTAQLRQLLHKPHGIFLVTGPTGSGKSTTLYAGLQELNNHSRNILTVEDPIEYMIEGIGQTQVNTRVGMTFARGLRAILRQDPDVVMVGEIRDTETAEIAVQASLTGHLVLSTLHTNTAVGAITRLQDMGVEPFLLSSSLTGVMAQRLVRTLCPDCRQPAPATDEEKRLLGITDARTVTLYHPQGCPACNHKGFRGRTAIHELIVVDATLRDLIHRQAGELELERYVRQHSAGTRATVAPDWMSIPCGFMACDAQRVICRIDECRGWSAGLALAPVMFRAQLNEQDLPLSLTVVGIAPEKLSAWAGADAERLTVTALPAITTYGEPEGNLLTGPWQPRVSYRKQWARWRVMILPILLILVALAVERGVTLWSVSEQVAQSRTQAEEQFLTLFPEQKRIVNLRSQVTMALKKYRPQADDTRLLAELSAIASTLKSASLSDIEMRGFTFDQKRQILHLQLRAANFASFDKLRSALATDYVVQQDALQKEGDAVSGGVTLRRK